MEFFRHCPGCGRRFHIKLVDKKLVEIDRTRVESKSLANPLGGGLPQGTAPAVYVVEEGGPVMVDMEEFQYAYKCKHCGHMWTEMHVEERKEHK